MTRPTVSRRACLLTALLAACGGGGDGTPTPAPLSCPTAQVVLCTDSAAAAALKIALADATDRVLPGLDARVRADIAPHLSALRVAIESGQVSAARDAVLDLDVQLDGQRNAGTVERPSLDHIGLAMLRASLLVGGPVTQYPH